MRIACVQPSYIPWRGYFHIIQKCDVFVFYDDVQYTTRDWRNRNRIKTPHGTKWLTVPVVHVKRGTPIDRVVIDAGSGWAEDHWNRIERSYRAAPYFSDYAPRLRELYERPWTSLSELDIALTEALCDMLGVRVAFRRASELGVTGVKTERLLRICAGLGATSYLSGPAAKSYIDPADFDRAGVALEWMVYDYQPYDQLYPPYDPAVSVIDLLFMTGRDAGKHIWGDLQPS